MTRSISLFMTLAVTLLFTGFSSPAASDDSAGVSAQFVRPSRQYSSGPLWVWNDLLTEARIRGTLRDLSRQHVRQVWVHPRPGLMTPYLGEDWFHLWKVALDEAERLDMNVWIYDENSYPSGFAGGLVPEAMPESRGQGLHFNESERPAQPADDLVAVYRLTEDRRKGRYWVSLPDWYGSVARVVVNGKAAGRIAHAPWECDVTDSIRPGHNTIEVVVVGTLKNTLGPHHAGHMVGKAWPNAFQKGPKVGPPGGKQYDTLGYGLFKPFVLTQLLQEGT